MSTVDGVQYRGGKNLLLFELFDTPPPSAYGIKFSISFLILVLRRKAERLPK